MKNKIDWKIVVTGIIALVIIQGLAMHYGVNGNFRMVIVGAILFAMGVNVDKEKFIKSE